MVENKYIKDFEGWCRRENIRLTPNTEIFFINARKTLVPMYKAGTNVFLHVADSIPEEDYPMYQSFAKSFYTIIVFPKDVIADLIKNITRKDIIKHFKVSI